MQTSESESEVLRHQVQFLCDELARLYSSRSWKLAEWMRRARHPGNYLLYSAESVAGQLSALSRRSRYRRVMPDLPWKVRVDLGSHLGVQFHHHRSGWTYAVAALSALHRAGAPFLDTFVERTFAGRWSPPATHLRTWAGICHLPFSMPAWLPEYLRAQFFGSFSRSVSWECSLRSCAGLFALSEAHAADLRRATGLPVCMLLHPTEVPSRQWSWDRFLANPDKKVIQVGWWLRNLHAIFLARFPGYRKVLLEVAGQHVKDYFQAEEEHLFRQGAFRPDLRQTVQAVPYVSNEVYDDLLSENLVFLDLYASSANNAIVECIARGTPLLVNRLPAVEEYLGSSYPLYYSSYEEAEHKAADVDLIQQAHAHLASEPVRRRIDPRTFLRAFMRSEVFQRLGRDQG